MPFQKKNPTVSEPQTLEAIPPTATPPLTTPMQAAVPPPAAAPASGALPNADQTVVVTANVDQVASSLRRMGKGIPKMEDVAFDSMDQASKGVPQALLKLGKERGIAFYRLGWDGIQEHPLITTGIAVPMTVDNFPECEPFLSADGLVHMRDTIICVAMHDVAIKKIRDPQLKRAEAYNQTITKPDVMTSSVNNTTVEGRVEKTITITPGA